MNMTNMTDNKLLKIGQVAKQTGELVTTLRFYLKEGLITVRDTTRSGYQLFDPSTVDRIRQIRLWQKDQRLTLSEIKGRLNNG